LKTKITLPIILFFFATVGIAQTRKQIIGRIVVADASPANVIILNLNTEQEAISDKLGSFSLLVQPEDVLVFSSENLDYLRKIVEQYDCETGTFEIKMTSKLIVLDEVEIKTYNAVDLGILERPAKSYTTAERRLKTAGDFKPIHLLALLGGSMPLDPVFNAINGKTKRLKKEILLEQNQKRLQQFQAFFPAEELIKNVKVKADEVTEFSYFVLEEEQFKSILNRNDKSKMLFYLIQKHFQFQNNKILDEKK
jgi:hypothetical protein